MDIQEEIKQELNDIKDSVDSISHLLDILLPKHKDPETDSKIGICLDIINDKVKEIDTLLNKEELLKEYTKKMENCVYNNYDPEVAHSNADTLLVELLDKLGFCNVTFEYNQVKKWYA